MVKQNEILSVFFCTFNICIHCLGMLALNIASAQILQNRNQHFDNPYIFLPLIIYLKISYVTFLNTVQLWKNKSDYGVEEDNSLAYFQSSCCCTQLRC